MTVVLKPRIVVIGVGGAGGNAVNNMIDANLQGVEFIVANTDAQALSRSKAETQLQLGVGRTAGLGAGANPEVGSEAAKESAEEIKKILQGAHMCFIAAGMGGGTGTGAAPIIARIAREQKVLTVGVVTKPFEFEGKRRMAVAEKGIVDLRAEVDTLIIIPNQNLFRVASNKTSLAEAFGMADRVLYSGVRGITDLMVMPGLINLDFADVRTVMAGMGTAMMGQGEAEGDTRALEAARAAISNPLLDDVSLKGAKGVIINITGGYDMTLFEVDEAANEIRREVDADGHIILGSTFDENMQGKIRVSVVAAGIQQGVAQAPPSPSAVRTGVLAQPAVTRTSTVREMLQEAAAPLVAAQQAPAHTPEPINDMPPAAEPVAAPEASGLFPSARVAPVIRRHTPEEVAPEPVAETQPEPAPASRSLSSLFNWKRPASDAPAAPAAAPVAPQTDDSFDDELEIPAFLRRSANN